MSSARSASRLFLHLRNRVPQPPEICARFHRCRNWSNGRAFFSKRAEKAPTRSFSVAWRFRMIELQQSPCKLSTRPAPVFRSESGGMVASNSDPDSCCQPLRAPAMTSRSLTRQIQRLTMAPAHLRRAKIPGRVRSQVPCAQSELARCHITGKPERDRIGNSTRLTRNGGLCRRRTVTSQLNLGRGRPFSLTLRFSSSIRSESVWMSDVTLVSFGSRSLPRLLSSLRKYRHGADHPWFRSLKKPPLPRTLAQDISYAYRPKILVWFSNAARIE